MKHYLLIIAVVALVGCSKKTTTDELDGQTVNPNIAGNKSPKAKPKKPKKTNTELKSEDKDTFEVNKTKTETQNPEEKLVGSYEGNLETKVGGKTGKLVLLKNGTFEVYENDEKEDEGKWGVVGKDVHLDTDLGGANLTLIFKIESNGDLTIVAGIAEGSRKEVPKDKQVTFKKIK